MNADAVDLRGMVSLEMLGYCDHRPNSQALPRALVGMYPETANFIAIIGNQNSHELIEQFRTGSQKAVCLQSAMLWQWGCLQIRHDG